MDRSIWTPRAERGAAPGRTHGMALYMIIERFRAGGPDAAGERFRTRGRLMPEGVEFVDSWMTADGAACYQINRAHSRDLIDAWIANWSDLVEFEVAEIVPSDQFWARRAGPG